MMKQYDIVFLGGLFPKEFEQEIINHSIGSIQNAANAVQWEFVKGLDTYTQQGIKLINSLYVGSFPQRYKKPFIKTASFSHCEKAQDINVGFCNLFGVKHFFRYQSLKPHLKKWALDGKQNKVIIAYALTNTFASALAYIKKINPSVCTCMIVPDLPQYMNTSDKVSPVYQYLKEKEIKKINQKLHHIDGFVLLTKQMNDLIKADKFTVIEGMSTDLFQTILPSEPDGKDIKTILYTGTLNRKYGILNLLEAFEKLPNKNYRLIICGAGDCQTEIEAWQKKDPRVIFKGQLGREAVLQLQADATVLVNPRQNTEAYTKYSFPSKNIEYLSSAVPLVAYKLDGIPDEYDSYIQYVQDNSVEALSNKLLEICELPSAERKQIGTAAKNFVLHEKNNVVAAQKILNLIGRIYE